MKFLLSAIRAFKILSPPARGAWIEICNFLLYSRVSLVAPRTGGVD